jgi:competence protein ComEA
MRRYGLLAAAALALSFATPAAAQAPLGLQQFAQAALDIHSASKEQLDALPGVGTARADAIIKGRPYKGKDDLVQKGIIPQSVYDGIKDKIIARQR